MFLESLYLNTEAIIRYYCCILIHVFHFFPKRRQPRGSNLSQKETAWVGPRKWTDGRKPDLDDFGEKLQESRGKQEGVSLRLWLAWQISGGLVSREIAFVSKLLFLSCWSECKNKRQKGKRLRFHFQLHFKWSIFSLLNDQYIISISIWSNLSF